MIQVPKIGGGPGKGGAGQGRDLGGHRKTMWLISFTDLISLMLAFFVLMYSMSEPESQRWIRLTKGLAETIPAARSTATAPSDRPADPRAAFNAQAVELRPAAVDVNYLGALLRSQTTANAELAGVEVRREDDRVVIGLPGERMFDASGAVFTEEGRRIVFLLGAVVGRIGNRIEVVGHAEREDQTGGAAWERALTRAVAVSAALRETGYRRDLVARAVMVAEEPAPVGGVAGVGVGVTVPINATGRVRVDIVVREEGAD
jgi:chemotaxis protein MotB